MKHRQTVNPHIAGTNFIIHGVGIFPFSQLLTPKYKYKSFAQCRGSYMFFSSIKTHFISMHHYFPLCSLNRQCAVLLSFTLKDDSKVIYRIEGIFFLEMMSQPYGSSWHVQSSGQLYSYKLDLILYSILDLQTVKNQCNLIFFYCYGKQLIFHCMFSILMFISKSNIIHRHLLYSRIPH